MCLFTDLKWKMPPEFLNPQFRPCIVSCLGVEIVGFRQRGICYLLLFEETAVTPHEESNTTQLCKESNL